ncbi:hypothetical protein MRY87_12210 [bacterium]|nr:hypothetical protein [bacterium]
MVSDMFLLLNGLERQPAKDSRSRVRFFEDVASKKVTRFELADFYRDNCQ